MPEIIIDIHAHTSQHMMHGLHTQMADLSDLHQSAHDHGISKIFLMATSFPLKGSGLSTVKLLERIGSDELFGCFGTLNLEKATARELDDLRALAKSGSVDGFKIYPGYQNFTMSNPAVIEVMTIAAQYSLPVACHTGELHHCCPKELRTCDDRRCGYPRCPLDQRGFMSHPSQLHKLATQFQGVNIIACHLGNPYFEELREVMRNHSNVYTDISGQFISGTDEDTPEYRAEIVAEVRKFIALERGIDRILFGSDYPIQSHASSLALIDDLSLSPPERSKILSGNALSLLPKRKGATL